MHIVLEAGDTLRVTLEDTDGEFVIDYDSDGSHTLQVITDMPDTSGRNGVIYREDFSNEWPEDAQKGPGKPSLGESEPL